MRGARVGLMAVMLLAVCAAAAEAAYPGADGRIAFVRRGTCCNIASIYTVTSTGDGLRRITFGHTDVEPRWSPDGTRIAPHRRHRG